MSSRIAESQEPGWIAEGQRGRDGVDTLARGLMGGPSGQQLVRMLPGAIGLRCDTPGDGPQKEEPVLHAFQIPPPLGLCTESDLRQVAFFPGCLLLSFRITCHVLSPSQIFLP